MILGELGGINILFIFKYIRAFCPFGTSGLLREILLLQYISSLLDTFKG